MAERTTGGRTQDLRFGWGEVIPWRGDPQVAHLLLTEGARPERGGLRHCLALLAQSGYTSVITSAVTTPIALPFLDEGLVVRERLRLLCHSCEDVPGLRPTAPRARRARRTDREPVLELDALTFDGFWQMDARALGDALTATPAVRFRVGDHSRGLAAYAITGRAGHRGYLQRIAVHPAQRNRGWGHALVIDALRWLVRHGTRQALVNTQWENRAALALYLMCGFRQLPTDLHVLERAL